MKQIPYSTRNRWISSIYFLQILTVKWTPNLAWSSEAEQANAGFREPSCRTPTHFPLSLTDSRQTKFCPFSINCSLVSIPKWAPWGYNTIRFVKVVQDTMQYLQGWKKSKSKIWLQPQFQKFSKSIAFATKIKTREMKVNLMQGSNLQPADC